MQEASLTDVVFTSLRIQWRACKGLRESPRIATPHQVSQLVRPSASLSGRGWPMPTRHAVITQLAAGRTHRPKVVSSIFTRRGGCAAIAEAFA